MAKNTTTTVKTSRRGQNALPIAAPDVSQTLTMPTPMIQLDMTIKTDDLVGIVVSDRMEDLTMQRANVESKLDDINRQHAREVKKLEGLAKKVIDEQTGNGEAAAVVAALDVFSGTKHAIKIVSVDAVSTYYRYDRPEKDEEPEVNVKKGLIIGEVRIIRGDSDKTIVARKRIEIPFTDSMKETVSTIETVTRTLHETQDELGKIGREMHDAQTRLPGRAKSELVKAYLSGNLASTQNMLDVVTRTPVKALPNNVING